MHELSLAQGIIDLIDEQARVQSFRRVRQVHLVVGALSHALPEALAFAFDSVTKGTIAEGATLHIKRPPGVVHCVSCGASSTIAQRGDPCPSCGSFQVLVTSGDELRVTDLDVE